MRPCFVNLKNGVFFSMHTDFILCIDKALFVFSCCCVPSLSLIFPLAYQLYFILFFWLAHDCMSRTPAVRTLEWSGLWKLKICLAFTGEVLSCLTAQNNAYIWMALRCDEGFVMRQEFWIWLYWTLFGNLHWFTQKWLVDYCAVIKCLEFYIVL